MTTDITELAQSLKAAAEKYKSVWGIARYSKAVEAREKFHELVTPSNVIALVEALEKAQTINAAAEKLVRCKGRYHSEQNYRALAALFGVNTPDLPPLDDESHAVTVENLQESAYRAGLTAGWNLGLANNNEGFNKCLAAHTAGFKVKAE
ncbi:hypothetical protein ACHA0F_004701 [Klebsiella pneumoniae]